MIPLIYHYVFLLKMTQLTISTWRVIEGDLLCWGKCQVARSVRRVSGTVTHRRGGPGEGGNPHNSQLSFGKEQGNGRGAQVLLSPMVGGGMLEWAVSKRKSPLVFQNHQSG